MKRNGTLLNTRLNGFSHDDIGDEHVSTSVGACIDICRNST
jgi:hypothetical protein